MKNADHTHRVSKELFVVQGAREVGVSDWTKQSLHRFWGDP